MKPLSEQALKEAVLTILRYPNGKRPPRNSIAEEIRHGQAEKLVNLILSDRKAWGEQLLEDLKLTASKHYYTRGYGEPTILVSEWVDYLDLKIKEQRNQGEKTDE